MFGTRLKSWMEAHLGRPRQKSGHHNQKNHRASKDVVTPSGSSSCSSSGGGGGSSSTQSIQTTTGVSSSCGGAVALSSSNGNPNPGGYNNLKEQGVCNGDSFSPTSPLLLASTSSPPSTFSSVQIQSSSVLVGPSTAQLQKQHVDDDNPRKDNDEKLQEHSQQQHRTTCTRSSTTGSVSNSGSHNILLGAFCNNLSSPDTGYSTDGYSPKSVYPVLSFESSGKSTPKSSYTISSLVSSELHLGTSSSSSSKVVGVTGSSLSSTSCSVNNGLESDQDNDYLSPSTSSMANTTTLPPLHSETDRRGRFPDTNFLNSVDESTVSKSHNGGSPATKHAINQVSDSRFLVTDASFRVCNDIIRSSSPSNSVSPPSVRVKKETKDLPKKHNASQGENSYGESAAGANSMVAATRPIISVGESRHDKSDFVTRSSILSKINRSQNPFRNQVAPSPSISTDNNQANNNHHKRTESLEEKVNSRSESRNGESVGAGGNSSSLLTAPANRNNRTSFVLTAPANTNHIADSNGLGLKNAFSICSPRKGRTRIKTNPWIKYNDGNSNANSIEPNANPGITLPTNTAGHRYSAGSGVMGECSSDSGGLEKVEYGKNSQVSPQFQFESDNRNKNGCMDIDQQVVLSGQNVDNSIVFPSAVTSAPNSDSGKGSSDLESANNRNSTESSCLLSDSSPSPRNSINSHEIELGESSSSSIVSQQRNNGGQTLSSNYNPNQYDNTGVLVFHHDASSSAPPMEIKRPVNTKINHLGTNQVENSRGQCNNRKHDGGKPSLKSRHVSHGQPGSSSTSITHLSKVGGGESNSMSLGAQANVIMVDKETDILSDWANTDEDCDDETEPERKVTSISSDTDTGGRVIFQSHSNTGSITDLDFGDSSVATPASSIVGRGSTSPIIHNDGRRHNKKMKKRESASGADRGDDAMFPHDPYHDSILTNLPTSYNSPHMTRDTGTTVRHNVDGITSAWNPCESVNYDEVALGRLPYYPALLNHQVEDLRKSGLMAPTSHALGIPNANISLSSLYSNASEYRDYNDNKPHHGSSNPIARGALGFLRKIFKKSSCSSHRTSPGSDKAKLSRSGRSKDSLDNIESFTGLRSTLLTTDALLSPHPLVSRKPSANGYFLTPTPNAFRRRSTTGTDSSESRSSGSKHHKSVKTDIIRLPQGTLSPTLQGQAYLQNPSSSSVKNNTATNNGATSFCLSSFQQNKASGNGSNIHGYSNSNTNSNSTTSSIHSMSTSTSLTSGCAGGENHVNGHNNPTSKQNQSHLNDNLFHNADLLPLRQQPHNNRGNATLASHSNGDVKFQTVTPQLQHTSSGNGNPTFHHSSTYASNGTPADVIACQSEISYQNHSQPFHERDFHHHQQQRPERPQSRTGVVCPYESPRLQNPLHKINSPSFNNYSPMHRLAVTGGNHILPRTGSASAHSSSHDNNASFMNPMLLPHHQPRSQLRSEVQTHASSSSVRKARNESEQDNCVSVPPSNNHIRAHSSSTFSPNINRLHNHPPPPPNPTSSPSPLINHRNQSISTSSPRPSYSSPSPSTFISPSPILRNPRYQYITSSNQNSPVLNVPKRIGGGGPPPPSQKQQNYYYHNNNQKQEHEQGEDMGSFPYTNPKGTFSTFSPTPPPRQSVPGQPRNSTNPNNNCDNSFSAVASNLNHHQLCSKPTIPSSGGSGGGTSINPLQHHGGSMGCKLEILNSPNPNRAGRNVTDTSNSAACNRNNILSHSQTYQPQDQGHEVHYYASQVVVTPQIQTDPKSHTPHPTTLSFNEPPLLMRTHLHNQNVRLNNFLKQRHQQQSASLKASARGGHKKFHNSESFQERIYERVDSDEENSNIEYDDDGADEGNPENGRGDMNNYYPHQADMVMRHSEQFHPVKPSQFSRMNATTFTRQLKNEFKPDVEPKPRRTMREHLEYYDNSDNSGSGMYPYPQVPMEILGPNTFLSETETRILEADREADRKYKRLINEAEALLREISAVKSQQTSIHKNHHHQERLRIIEDCPQSDPLRRKAYDCWALRRLQQELAGCCASPPVLHRSRMNLQSPSTPTATGYPYFSPGLSLVPSSNVNVIDHNQQKGHF